MQQNFGPEAKGKHGRNGLDLSSLSLPRLSPVHNVRCQK
jgi:hypothetical protein